MPYTVKGKCVYKKDGGAKVGCTQGSVKKYLAALHANANESVTEANAIKGGKADKLSLQQIADKFDVSIEKIKSQIQKGIKIEMEHTSDKEKAREIATDHISEFPDYYDRLGKMEKKAEKQWELNETKKFIKQRLRENLESTHIEIDKDYGYCVGNVHNDTAKIMNWFSFRKFDFTKYEKYLKKPVAFLNNIYVEADKKGMGMNCIQNLKRNAIQTMPNVLC